MAIAADTRRRRRARIALLLTAAFTWGAPMAAIATVIGLAIAVAIVHGGPLIWVVVLGGRVWLTGALAILHERRPARPVISGVDVARSDEPGLWRLVDRAADGAGVEAPAVLRLSAEERVTACRESGGLLVAVGLPWLSGTEDELVAAVAHALVCERLGTGSRKTLLIAERLQRARDVVRTRATGRVWRPYLRAGVRLQRWVGDLQTSGARATCERALGADAVAAWERATIHHGAFSEYWERYVGPCLTEGFAPPIIEGWRLFDGSEPAASHPEIALSSTSSIERRVLGALFADSSRVLVELPWTRLADAVWLPQMRRGLRAVALAPFTPRTLELAIRAAPAGEIQADDREDVVAAALTLALVDVAGWTAEGLPGSPITLRHEDVALRPFGLCRSVTDGSWDPEGWEEFAGETEILDLVVDAAALVRRDVELPGPDIVVPAMTPRRVELARTPARASGYAILAFGALIGFPTAGLLFAAASRVPTGAGAVVMVVCGAALLAGLTAWLRSRVRIMRCRGVLTVTADGAQIEHPGLLKEPFVVPRDAVRAVMIDDGVWSEHQRFPIGPADVLAPSAVAAGQDVAWLWTKDAPVLVPLLGIGTETPNVALMVGDPTLTPRVRRVVLTGPIPGEALTGLLLAVADAASARAAFAPWGVTRGGRQEDAEHVSRGYLGARART